MKNPDEIGDTESETSSPRVMIDDPSHVLCHRFARYYHSVCYTMKTPTGHALDANMALMRSASVVELTVENERLPPRRGIDPEGR